MNITTKMAAECLGCSEQAVRSMLISKALPIGEAIKVGGRYQYIIPELKFAQYMGVSVDVLRKYLEGVSNG